MISSASAWNSRMPTRCPSRWMGRPPPGVPTGESNLTVRAAQALRAPRGPAPRHAGVAVEDRAARRRAGRRIGRRRGCPAFRDRPAREPGRDDRTGPRRRRRAGVGSDVPALLALAGQRVRGRGERIEALTIPTLHLAIASTTRVPRPTRMPPLHPTRFATTAARSHSWRGSSAGQVSAGTRTAGERSRTRRVPRQPRARGRPAERTAGGRGCRVVPDGEWRCRLHRRQRAR